MKDISTQLHRITIKILNSANTHHAFRQMTWDGLSNDIMIRWQWYFRYRQALWQVEHPRKRVIMERYTYQPETITERQQAAVRLKNRITARKRKITEIKNKIKLARQSWSEIFPMEEHPYYHQAAQKLQRLQREEKEMREQYKKLI